MSPPEGREVSHGKLHFDSIVESIIPTEDRTSNTDKSMYGIVPKNIVASDQGKFRAFISEASRSPQPERIEAGLYHVLETLSTAAAKPSYILMRLINDQLVVARKGNVQLFAFNFDAEVDQLAGGGVPAVKKSGELDTIQSTHELSHIARYLIVSTGLRQLNPDDVKKCAMKEQKKIVENLRQWDSTGSLAVITLATH